MSGKNVCLKAIYKDSFGRWFRDWQYMLIGELKEQMYCWRQVKRPEWFCTELEAIKVGFRKGGDCR